MTCYRCLRRVTIKDNIVFVAGNAAHMDACPKRKRRVKR